MFDWTDFDAVFRTKQDYTIDQKHTDAIVRQRKEFGGALYFDRIWSSIGLKQGMSWSEILLAVLTHHSAEVVPSEK